MRVADQGGANSSRRKLLRGAASRHSSFEKKPLPFTGWPVCSSTPRLEIQFRVRPPPPHAPPNVSLLIMQPIFVWKSVFSLAVNERTGHQGTAHARENEARVDAYVTSLKYHGSSMFLQSSFADLHKLSLHTQNLPNRSGGLR